MKKVFFKIAFFAFCLALFLPIFFGLAEISNFDKQKTCNSMEEIEKICSSISSAECRKILEECESYLEEESKKIEKDISKTKKQKATLSSEINNLINKIKDLEYKIQQNKVSVKNLILEIEDTQVSIKKTSERLEKSKEELKGILREIDEREKEPLIGIILTEDSLSGFFDELFYLETLSEKTKNLVEEIKGTKRELEEKEEIMTEKKTDLENLLKVQMLQKSQSEEAKKEKDILLKMTEAEYQKYLKEKQKIESQAAKIRSRIFELIGVVKAPTFGEAYELAKYVERITQIRPAFLLAILTQESNIGKNVGQCYLKDVETGAGVNIRTGATVNNVMKPSRDINPFLEITQQLKRDSFNTPVSCPIASVGGYGGAMGPAQFIPSTWMRYKDRLYEILGKTPDPWSIKDSFLAAGLLLKDLGASSRSPEAERKAAILYFSGSTNSRYSFYAESVMSIAQKYEQDIAVLEQSK
jgi:peptidoglycan hydrolase CwlO-like protein